MDYYNLKIDKIKLEKNRRIIVISDIHGGYKLFKKLLKKVSFAKKDYLFILGDVIEKGPQSFKTLRYVMKLYKRDNVFLVIGNNDLTLLDILEDKYLNEYPLHLSKNKSIYHEFAKKLNIKISLDTSISYLNSLIRKKYRNELEFFKTIPTIIETDNLLFAHASITSYEYMNSLNPFEVMKYDYFMKGDFKMPKRLIVGHYPCVYYNNFECSLLPVTDYTKNITSIDGGYMSKIGGELNALVFNNEMSLNETYYFVDDVKKVKVYSSQEFLKGKTFCVWDREEFEVLKLGNDKSLCLVNGKETFIPNDFILFYKNKYRCLDYIDDFLDVKKGEKVGLIFTYDDVSFIKKDDKLGFIKNIHLKK